MALRPFHPEPRPDRLARPPGLGAFAEGTIVPEVAAPSAAAATPRVPAPRIVGGSLVHRRAQGTATQLRGVHVYDPVYQTEHAAALRAFAAPDPARPLVIEVGFQLGRFARAYCELHPEARLLGFEIRRKFVEEADTWLQRSGCQNYRLALVDAREALPELVQPASASAILAFFPDPWWKTRHRKRRLLDRHFAALAAELLAPGGELIVKTDVVGYAAWAAGELAAVRGLEVSWLRDASAGLPPTRRERGCAQRGLPTWAVVGRRTSEATVEMTNAINPFDAAGGEGMAAEAPPAGDPRWR